MERNERLKDGKFEAEDFAMCTLSDLHNEQAAAVANTLLPALKEQWREEMLRDAPVVYLNRKCVNPKVYAKYWTEYENDLTLDGPTTHTAKLVCIEKLEEK